MPMAAVIHEKGTPDVFRWEEVEVGSPGKAKSVSATRRSG